MTNQDLRIECIRLAANIPCEQCDVGTLICQAREIYDFVACEHEPTVQSTSDPETPYRVSYVAERPTGAVSREWLHGKLTEMLRETESERDSADQFTNALRKGQCDALQWVIELISTPPKTKNLTK